MRVERRHRQADEADERSGLDDLGREEARLAGGQAHLVPVDQRIGLLAGQGRGEVLHHLRIGVESGERCPVLLVPLP